MANIMVTSHETLVGPSSGGSLFEIISDILAEEVVLTDFTVHARSQLQDNVC